MEITEFKGILNKIKSKVEEEYFLEKPDSYIFDYDPKYETVVRDYIKSFLKFYNYENSKIKPINIDLFNLIIEMFSSKNIGTESLLDRLIKTEKEEGSEKLLKSLRGTLKAEYIIGNIISKIDNHNLLLLTGVGKIYPLIRTHTITMNLDLNIPIILFYPGSYNAKYGVNLFEGTDFKGLGYEGHYRSKKLIIN